MVVKINKMSSEAGRNFTCTLGTLALSRDLATACEMLIRTSSQQTELSLEAGAPFEGSMLFRSVKASTPHDLLLLPADSLQRGSKNSP